MADNAESNHPVVVNSYIREMLELNPMWQSQQILRRRREIFGVAPATKLAASSTAAAAASNPQQAARTLQRARRILQTLQQHFYELPADQLAAHVRDLQNAQLPQYATVANRLAEVAAHRDTLREIEQQSDDPKFVYSLLQGLIAPAAEAAALKEQYVESIISERRVRPACKAVETIAQRYPQIVSLQQDWFDLLRDRNNQKQWTRTHSLLGRGRDSLNQWNAIVIAGIFIAMMLIQGIVGQREQNSPNTRWRQPTPSPATPPRPTYIPPRAPVIPKVSVPTPSIDSPILHGGKTADEIIQESQQQADRILQEQQELMQRLREGRFEASRQSGRASSVFEMEQQSGSFPAGRSPGLPSRDPVRPQIPSFPPRVPTPTLPPQPQRRVDPFQVGRP